MVELSLPSIGLNRRIDVIMISPLLVLLYALQSRSFLQNHSMIPLLSSPKVSPTLFLRPCYHRPPSALGQGQKIVVLFPMTTTRAIHRH